MLRGYRPVSPSASGASSRRPAPPPPTAPTSCAARVARSSISSSASRISTRRAISGRPPPARWTPAPPATRRWPARSSFGRRSPTSSRARTASLRPRRDRRDERREERDLRRLRRDAGPRRRGHDPGALLGLLPRHGARLRRRAGARRLPRGAGLQAHAGQLEAAITPRTRWLVLNSPSNPTGATYTADEYRALAEVLARHPHVLVMTDDIYEHIRFDDAPPRTSSPPRPSCAIARWRSTASPRPTR